MTAGIRYLHSLLRRESMDAEINYSHDSYVVRLPYVIIIYNEFFFIEIN